MAKKMIRFENELIGVYDIKRITKSEKWNFFNDSMDFLIEINKPFNESGISLPHLVFKYNDEKLRDDKMETLELLITQEGDIEING